ncbi:MAG: protein ImuA [Halocynthiibacter sp.]|jgi:protein ImuA
MNDLFASISSLHMSVLLLSGLCTNLEVFLGRGLRGKARGIRPVRWVAKHVFILPAISVCCGMVSDFSSYFPLRKNRVHEATGPGALIFAFALAGQLGGPVLWARESWHADQISPVGFHPYFDPANLLIAKGKDQAEILATAEEALRSGAVALTVVELSKPIGLTAGRRLQLAAEAGGSTGLCLVADGMGSNAAQTRWHCAPVFDPADSTLQCWKLIKNKSGTLKAWEVRWNAEARRIIVVSQVAQRPNSQGSAR